MPSKNIRGNRSKRKIDFANQYVLLVSRSNKNILAQVIEPKTKKTLFTISSNSIAAGTKTDKSVEVGKLTASKLKERKIEKVVFYRNGYLYHGRIASMVEAVRNEGITI